jgi:hypothetical protein
MARRMKRKKNGANINKRRRGEEMSCFKPGSIARERKRAVTAKRAQEKKKK